MKSNLWLILQLHLVKSTHKLVYNEELMVWIGLTTHSLTESFKTYWTTGESKCSLFNSTKSTEKKCKGKGIIKINMKSDLGFILQFHLGKNTHKSVSNDESLVWWVV